MGLLVWGATVRRRGEPAYRADRQRRRGARVVRAGRCLHRRCPRSDLERSADDVHLRRRAAHGRCRSGWTGSIATVAVSASDQYDNLTRRHILSRTVDGRVEESSVTEDASVVERWLTTFTRLPLCRTSKLDSSRDYYVRISARSRPHGSSLLGWANAITGQAKFTFIP